MVAICASHGLPATEALRHGGRSNYRRLGSCLFTARDKQGAFLLALALRRPKNARAERTEPAGDASVSDLRQSRRRYCRPGERFVRIQGQSARPACTRPARPCRTPQTRRSSAEASRAAMALLFRNGSAGGAPRKISFADQRQAVAGGRAAGCPARQRKKRSRVSLLCAGV